MAAALKPDDPAFIVYTSGTTGNPKGALISHGKHLAGTLHHRRLIIRRCARRITAPWSSCRSATSRPRRRDHAAADLAAGAAFRRRRRRPAADACSRWRRPSCSRCRATCRNSRRRCWSASSTSSPTKRAVYKMAMRLARAHARRRWAGKAGAATRARFIALRAPAAFRPMLNKLGFDKLELVDFRRRAAARRDHGALADLGRQVCRDVRPDRNRRRASSPASAGPSRAGQCRHRAGRLAGAARRRRRDPGRKAPDLFEGYWQNDDATEVSAAATTAGCIPAMSANGGTAICA